MMQDKLSYTLDAPLRSVIRGMLTAYYK